MEKKKKKTNTHTQCDFPVVVSYTDICFKWMLYDSLVL